LSITKERKRRPPDLLKAGKDDSLRAGCPGSFPLRQGDKCDELEVSLKTRQGLQLALQNRLEALAERSKKGQLQVDLAKAQIFHALDSEQANVAPSINTQIRTKRAIRNWRLGKSTDWIEDQKSGKWSDQAINYGPRIDPDLAASLVRHAFLRRERGRCEERTVEEAAGVKEADLTAIEHRAFELVIGKRGFTRTNAKDRAVPLARAVLRDCFPPESDYRLIPPTEAPALTIEKIVHIVVPFLDKLAGKSISYTPPDPDEDDPAKINPPALGALVAIARMAHPEASLERVRYSVRSYRKLELTAAKRIAKL
jgi:hypothetical protein